ncbi:zinc-binding dehydrogenase [Streptomyces sp. NPDC005865]|uniref:zinc-binding dehydrogenase n=1 Tax=Streptomyces sp. NPDC005865 TaxID=3155453 RepID=UPI0034054056
MAMPFNWPLSVHGYANSRLTTTPDGLRRVNAFIASGVRDGTLRPVVGEVFDGLDRIRDAHRLMESNDHVGKIVVRLDA